MERWKWRTDNLRSREGVGRYMARTWMLFGINRSIRRR